MEKICKNSKHIFKNCIRDCGSFYWSKQYFEKRVKFQTELNVIGISQVNITKQVHQPFAIRFQLSQNP